MNHRCVVGSFLRPRVLFCLLFRNGSNQAISIPREFELEGTKAIIHKEGDKLIIEPVAGKRLKAILASLSAIEEDFPEITDLPVEPEDIF